MKSEEVRCDDCGTTKGIVGDPKGNLCVDCMERRSLEHLEYLKAQAKEKKYEGR